MTAEKTNTKIITPTNQNEEKSLVTKHAPLADCSTDLHGDWIWR